MTLAGEMHDSPPLHKASSRASKPAGQRHLPNLRPESFSFREPSSASLSPLARSASPLSRLPSRSTPGSFPGARSQHARLQPSSSFSQHALLHPSSPGVEAGHHSQWLAEVLRRPYPATGLRTIQIAPHLTESLQTDTAHKNNRHRHHHHHGKHHHADDGEHEAGGVSRAPSCEDKTGEKKLLPRSPSSKLRLVAAVVTARNSFAILRDAQHARAERDNAALASAPASPWGNKSADAEGIPIEEAPNAWERDASETNLRQVGLGFKAYFSGFGV